MSNAGLGITRIEVIIVPSLIGNEKQLGFGNILNHVLYENIIIMIVLTIYRILIYKGKKNDQKY